jgi:hypothetical protein
MKNYLKKILFIMLIEVLEEINQIEIESTTDVRDYNPLFVELINRLKHKI